MDAVKPRRRYDASGRRRRSAETRARIAVAARELFARDGYAAMTIDAVARRAAVAPQTVYAVFGSKRALLSELIRMMEADADLAQYQAGLEAGKGDPRHQIALLAGFAQRIYARGGDVLAIVQGAGNADPDLAAAWQEGEGGRRHGVSALAREWEELGALKPGLTLAEAVDILWALSGPDVYRLLVSESGWPPERYEALPPATLEAQLL